MLAALVQACQSKPGSDGWFSSLRRDVAQLHAYLPQYGFERGTTEMAQCIQKEINAKNNEMRSRNLRLCKQILRSLQVAAVQG